MNPGMAESCSTPYDDNCDGHDGMFENPPGCVMFYEDIDGDGWGSGAPLCLCPGSPDTQASQGGTWTALQTNGE